MNTNTIKIDLEFSEESLEKLREISALGAAAVRCINPQPGDRIIFLYKGRTLSQESRAEFERLGEEALGCRCLVVMDVDEIIHLEANPMREVDGVT